MNPYPLAFTILASLATPYAAQAQDAPPNPFSRTMLTQNQIEALAPAAATPSSPPSDATAQAKDEGPLVVTKPTAVKPVQDRASAPPTPSTTQTTQTAQTAQTAPIQANKTPPAKPRYVEVPIENEGSIANQARKGQAKEAYYADKYNAPSYALPNSNALSLLTTSLGPLVERLRMQGIDEGKINVELNRLTPAQFIRWADFVKY